MKCFFIRFSIKKTVTKKKQNAVKENGMKLALQSLVGINHQAKSTVEIFNLATPFYAQ